jgi:hypothetical protein
LRVKCRRRSNYALPLTNANRSYRTITYATRNLANGRFGGDAKLHGEYYKVVLEAFWKSGSFPDGEIPSGPASAAEHILAFWRE